MPGSGAVGLLRSPAFHTVRIPKAGGQLGEAGVIAPWVLFIYLLLAVAGGTNAAPVNGYFGSGIVLFVLGSWMNSYAEYTRDARFTLARPLRRGVR